MGVPVPEMEPVEDATAAALLDSLKTIAAAERRKHASVFNYWLSIRGDRQFPPIRDLDPLEISDAGPFSILLEMIGGGEDATIRHLGQAIEAGVEVEKIGEAPNPSLLSCIAGKLPIVAACRQAFAFEDEFATDSGTARCWVTLLPFSANGTWIDYVYGFVSLEPAPDAVAEAPEADPKPIEESAEAEPEADPEPIEESAEAVPEPFEVPLGPLDEEPDTELEAVAEMPEPEAEPEVLAEAPEPEPGPQPELDPEPEPGPAEVNSPAPETRPSFSSKLFESLASAGGFYGRPVEVELDLETASFTAEEPNEPVAAEDSEPVAAEDSNELISTSEGPLQSKLADVRAKADEARLAKLRANAALYEGLSAAYDFALDAEEAPEEYLRLVEAQGLKIQLRSPMKPVVKLAFDGLCDDAVIAQLESVLAWALKQDLPRGSLAERIEAEGGLGPILNGQASAA